MSGYLERLVSSARNAGGAIHPMVGSLYSATKYESMPPVLEEDVAQSSQPESLAPPGPDPVLTRRLVPDSLGPLKGENFPSAPVGRVIGMQEGIESDVPSLHTKEDVRRPVEPTESSTKEIGAQRSEAPQQGPQPKTISRRPYKPLVVEQVHRTATERILIRDATPLTPLTAREKTSKENAEFFRRPLASEREPDEIQIHIGRIEVTAVPPAAARPAAPPARKSLNLAEYLKRRHGRAL